MYRIAQRNQPLKSRLAPNYGPDAEAAEALSLVARELERAEEVSMIKSPSGSSAGQPRPDEPQLEAASGVVTLRDFSQVYSDHFDFVWRFAAHRGVAEAALEDVVQETFVVVHKQLPGFLGRSSLRTWIAGIARNVMRGYLRKRANLALGDPLEAAAELPSLDPIPLEALEQKSSGELLDSILAKMTDVQREAFVLCEVEGFSVVETARALDVNESAMRSRLHDARKVFNAAIARLRVQRAWEIE